MAEFVMEGIQFFKSCNNFIKGIMSFINDPLAYIVAYGMWVSVFVTIIGIFAKACGFKSGKWITGGTVTSIILKILSLT